MHAINLLVLSMACTPIYLVFGFEPARALAKPLGLYGFAYALLHFINFIGIDYGFNLMLIRADALVKKRFIIAGLVALILLLPLAATSFGKLKEWRSRLSKILPLAGYLAVAFAVIHYLWQSKIDLRLPLIYGFVVCILLTFRIPPLRKLLERRLAGADPTPQ